MCKVVGILDASGQEKKKKEMDKERKERKKGEAQWRGMEGHMRCYKNVYRMETKWVRRKSEKRERGRVLGNIGSRVSDRECAGLGEKM